MILSILMAKKRKTRREKIILQLKRQLTQKNPKFELRQEAIPSSEKIEMPAKVEIKKPDISTLSVNLKLIKKDLIKTLILSLIVFSLEAVLYLKLK